VVSALLLPAQADDGKRPIQLVVDVGTLLGAAGTIAAGLTAGIVGACKLLITYLTKRDTEFTATITQVVNQFETNLKEEREDRRRSVDIAMKAQTKTVEVVGSMDRAITALRKAVDALGKRVDGMIANRAGTERKALPPHPNQEEEDDDGG
jgi:hypothetical protein